MPSVNQIVSAVAFAGLAVAAPTSDIVGKQTFSVPRQIVHEGTLPYGQHETLKTYRKFKAEAPSHVVAAAAAVTGRVTASPSDQYDSSYLCAVSVGGKTLNLDFDTGSSDLWVFSTLQPSSQTAGHNLYSPVASKKLSGYTWDISYGDGSGASGTVYRDTVTIGGVTYSKQAVEAATSVSSEFTQDTGTDGLVGLAFNSINTVEPNQQKTFFSNVASSLAKPVISANLKYHSAGEYDFGYIDSSKYTGSVAYTNVDNSQGFWGITVSGYGTTKTTKSTSFSAIADTGTTLIYVPSNVLSNYYSKVKGSQNSQSLGGYVFPCSATLPDFYLKIGSYTAKVPGKFINYAPADNTGATCYGGLQDSSSIGISILGDVFLKSQYVVFDLSVPRLGLAQQVGT